MSEESQKYSYGTSKEETFTLNIQGSMIKTINTIYSQQFKGCVQSAEPRSGHVSCTKHFLSNQPEVLMLSLSWGD
jgi:hypothetical protein